MQLEKYRASSSQSGIALIVWIIIIFLVLIGAITAADFGYVAYQAQQNVYPTVTPYPGEIRTPVSARGTFSKDKYSVTVTMNFLLEGGAVSGEFSGDCSGTISGSFDGKDGGVISGKAVGSCDPLIVPIPASATFTGTVHQTQKTVSITGAGSAAGFSGTGSMILSF